MKYHGNVTAEQREGRPAAGAVPTAETLPPTPTPPRPTITGHSEATRKERRTAFPMKSRPAKTGRTPADTVVEGRPKELKTKAENERMLRQTKHFKRTVMTPKLKRKLRKAEKWNAKFG